MRYLLDKVTARLIVRGSVKADENEPLTSAEMLALDLFKRAKQERMRLFIVAATANTLQHLAELPQYSGAIHRFLSRVEVAKTTRYYTRWARRLRGYAFTREDAAVIALATFGTDQKGAILGMKLVVTQDQPMINNWSARKNEIQERLDTMIDHLPPPYDQATLPEVLRPEDVVF